MVENPDDLAMVFMPLIFGALSEFPPEKLENIGILYEYISEAGPRSINGMPIFTSFKILSKEDTNYVFGQVRYLRELMSHFIKDEIL